MLESCGREQRALKTRALQTRALQMDHAQDAASDYVTAGSPYLCPSVRLSASQSRRSITGVQQRRAVAGLPAARARAAYIERYLPPVREPGLRPALTP